ncbi:WXG100 family type VII secretion target [Streptomyces oryzae]|uniref:WXG100 family type VII secretion target n=1 Tax=Streptomyces oryzae TaxID=1434886 RepID=A0ABS3X4L9_9ACTN|nr:WXG100 family type VII secretion target [Streptomyces oryzae]MBO8190328.1 WXG100 family type VII secretion target [Streptomyces oryzae]
MSDSGYTIEQFRIDLKQLNEAIGTISTIKTEITDNMSAVRKIMNSLGDAWSGPAHNTFHPMKTWFDTTQTDLGEMLDEIIRRLQSSYDNYHAAEQANFGNVTPEGPPPPGGSA